MSEWYEVKDKDDISLSEDGKTIDVLFNTNYAGNVYVEIPIEFLDIILKDQREKYKKILQFLDVPNILIENPELLGHGKCDKEDIEWALNEIDNFKEEK